MARLILVEEIHVEVRLPSTQSDPEVAAVRRVILTRAFLTRVKKAVRDLIAHDLAARIVHVRVSV